MNAATVLISVLSLFVAGLSLLVAYFSFRKSSAVQKRQLEIEEQRERDRVVETKKARLTAQVVKEPSAHSTPDYYLEITNSGVCQARDIEVKLDGKAAMEHPCVRKRAASITQIGPQSAARYELVVKRDIPFAQKAEIRWTDDSGEPGRYRTTLTQ